MQNKIKSDASVLIVSWSPVPTPKYQKIEGSGQRFFGLAKGLQANGVKDITIAIGHIYPLDVKEVEGIKLFNYDFDSEFEKKLNEYDTIIFNYAIHGSWFIEKNIAKDKQVIIDAYGPAYIESLARNPSDLVGTYIGNLAAVNDVFNKVLPRGDYFLYANDAQEKFYTGVLTTLGVINQFSYHTQRLILVPFGIDKPDDKQAYSNPYLEYGLKEDDFILLWFGGLYPWFDITKVIDTLKSNKSKKIKLVIVGGNNPQNQHPDFVKHYFDTVEYIKKHELEDQTVLIDWVDYATRRKYYEFADVIISMNSPSKENVYSWRTRVMDYVGSTTPLITNGGDPLSDELINTGAAFKVKDDNNDIAQVINDLVKNKYKLVNASNQMKLIQPKYFWENVTKELAKVVLENSRPYYLEQKFRQKNGIIDKERKDDILSSKPKRDIKGLLYIVIQKIKTDGFFNTYIIINDKLKRRIKYEYKQRVKVASFSEPRIIIVSNQLNNTGAPFVIIDLIEQINIRHPSLIKRIKFITFTPIEAANVMRLEKHGVDVEVYTNRELKLELNKDDIVVFNTFSMSGTTLMSAINSVKDNVVKKIYWYGHEFSPEGFIDNNIKQEINKLLNRDKAKIFSVSEETLFEYIKFFGTKKNIQKMPFRFDMPGNKWKIQQEKDFNKLRFISTGSLMDMRKGQYPILYAFLDFYHNYYKKSPKEYRDFHVEFVGAYEKSDLGPRAAYHIKNIKKQFDLSATALKDHFSITPSLPHEEAIKKMENSNITICYSLQEALPIFVYEGMALGHPLIRNESSGKEEQLVNGKNGYEVNSKDFVGLVEVIEKITNKSKTTNQDLVKMSQMSNKIAREATDRDYYIIDEISDIFNAD